MTSAEMRTPESVFKCGKAENYCDIKVLFKYLQMPPKRPYPVNNWPTRALQRHKRNDAAEHPLLEMQKY